MFNVTIRQVGIEEREEIIICCHEISDEVMSLANSIKGQKSFLLASKDGEMFKLDTKEIFYIESVDNKTFIYCKKRGVSCDFVCQNAVIRPDNPRLR